MRVVVKWLRPPPVFLLVHQPQENKTNEKFIDTKGLFEEVKVNLRCCIRLMLEHRLASRKHVKTRLEIRV